MKRFLRQIAGLTYVAVVAAAFVVIFLLLLAMSVDDPLTTARPTSGHPTRTCYRGEA